MHTPYILEGSNVFIGGDFTNSVFKKKLPPIVYKHLNEDFIKTLGNEKTFRKKLKTIHPIGRSGEPREVAELICWLVSESASFVTGQVWTIDGGSMTQLN